jgi:hypothetical protein
MRQGDTPTGLLVAARRNPAVRTPTSMPTILPGTWFMPTLVAGLALATTACPVDDDTVGRLCDLGAEAGPRDTVIATGSLDCTSRTCLKVPLTAELPGDSRYPADDRGLCTTTCSSDDDCAGIAGSPCQGGFTCAVATVVGPFCCEKVCVCRDYGTRPEPAACDADDPANTCCNLPGREGSDECR